MSEGPSTDLNPERQPEFPRRRLGKWIAAVGLMAAALCLGSSPAAATVVADSGFRVDPNGFAFPNYGNDEGYRNLDVDQMQRMYGRAVCIPGLDKCRLTPFAREWMKEVNEAMGDGHCYGFSVLSLVLQKNQLPGFGYDSIDVFGGGPFAFDLGIDGNTTLQRAIARAFVFQVFPSVTSRSVTGKPSRVLNRLIEEFDKTDNPESWTVSIFKPGLREGHAITPYAIEQEGEGLYKIKVYDNNFPGDDDRAITVNTETETWSYFAAINPDVPGSLYRGDARTRTLSISPTTPGLEIQPCEFCRARAGEGSKYNTITLSSPGKQHARLLITDPKGRKTGFIGNRLVNQIPGAQVMPRSSGGPRVLADGSPGTLGDSFEPIYRIPKRFRLKIKVNGKRMTARNTQQVSVSGPDFDASVERIRMGPGKVAHLTLNPKRLTLSATSPRKDRKLQEVIFGAEAKGKKPVYYRIRVFSISKKGGNTLVFANKRRFQLLRVASKTRLPQNYVVLIEKTNAAGKQTSFEQEWKIRGRQRSFLYYGPLASPKGRAKIVIVNSDGKVQRVLKVGPAD